MEIEKVRIGEDRSAQHESVVDEVTNTRLMDFPVQCSYRTTMLEQPTFHSHSGYELYLCIQGKGHYIVGDRMHTLGVGTFTVVGPMASHLSRPHLNTPFHRYILAIERSYVEQLCVEDRECLMGIRQWLPDPESDSIHTQLNAQQLMHLQEILVQLEGEIQRKQPCYPLLVKSLLLQLFAQLGRYQAKSSTISMGGNDTQKQMVKGILSYMMEHHHEPLSVEKLCVQFHVSRSFLFRIFKANTGVTMNEFLVSIRMTKAKELLQATDLAITAVAGRVGFQDVSHFCHTFKRLSGMTPSCYRSIHRSM
ncbi:AraC family transcriptional regulator [Paenibacillus macquariensis]|uniref:Transcriptional regulator, AraC family n=1 Tax=Paenibacillus macquariensis TaxID=948756 RepID=A0ABY1KDQ1_9BACL|nr:AraC family transcriptional regulator [Paenibacillus macquariensis]MEC0093828.1 AraC family transcriptional regulator [Paenibacillus macquariensis]OAB33611.1 hypothetical protein PMSM_13360 [Paenibacillus macquariensis subsp. macquariensis]SIR67405.1 transcriptional regulator, AraC family [Paenibacillus macquariensis]